MGLRADGDRVGLSWRGRKHGRRLSPLSEADSRSVQWPLARGIHRIHVGPGPDATPSLVKVRKLTPCEHMDNPQDAHGATGANL